MKNANRMYNAGNPYQGTARKVLCVCSAGLLRSPTAAEVLSQPPFGFNTRACGLDIGHALIPIDEVLIHWADEIVCMDEYQVRQVAGMAAKIGKKVKVLNLKIGDSYEFRNPELIQRIKSSYLALSKVE